MQPSKSAFLAVPVLLLAACASQGKAVKPSTEIVDAAPAAGFQTVRLPVRWSNHAAATAPYTIDPAFMQRVESVVDGLLAKNIYVMLNMHHYRQLDGDQLDTAEIAVSDAMLRERYLVLWQQIADRFHSRGDHLLFELYNEPHGRQTPEAWNDLAARALAVVRKGNPSRIVVIGGTPWNAASGLETLELPNDSNLIVTVHSYDPFRFTHQGAYWVHPRLPLGVHCCDAAQIAERFHLLVQFNVHFEMPSLLGDLFGDLLNHGTHELRNVGQSLPGGSRPRASRAVGSGDVPARKNSDCSVRYVGMLHCHSNSRSGKAGSASANRVHDHHDGTFSVANDVVHFLGCAGFLNAEAR